MRTAAAVAAITGALGIVASGGQSPAIRITAPTTETVWTGASRMEVAIDPPSALESVRSATFTVDGVVICELDKPPLACTWDPGAVVNAHHVRVAVKLADGSRLVANVHTKQLATYQVRTDAVLVRVIVTHGGQFVRGLKQEDFEIIEDGVKQSVASLVSEDAPLDLVLAIDVSGSMEHALDDVKSAVKQLLSKLRTGDAATIIGFNDTTFLATEREKDQEARERAVDLLTSWGGTALYDATISAIDLVSRDWGRKGIVIFSDGDDRNSITARDSATARVQASDAMLYTVGFGGGANVPGLRLKLEQYARDTGGGAVFSQKKQGTNRGVAEIRQGT